MKRFLTLFALIFMIAMLLVSCNATPSAPEGLQVVYESADGYTFYGPEGWIISNRAGIAASYVSGINKTSISFVKTVLPEGVTAESYFNKDDFEYDITLTKNGEACSFGTDNATVGYKYIYTFKFLTKDTADSDGDGNTAKEVLLDYTSMQIIVSHGGETYIFTYTALGTPDDEEANYRRYLEVVQTAIDNFKFGDTVSDSPDAPEYPKDEDGYSMVSDRSVCGFEFYLPDSFTVIDNSAIVSATLADGSTVSITKATDTGVLINKYWENRKAELSKFTDNLTLIRTNITEVDGELKIVYSDDIVFGNIAPQGVAIYEYTYEFSGVKYHVYQLFGLTANSGYVFTYTARDGDFASHLEEIKTIAKKVKF